MTVLAGHHHLPVVLIHNNILALLNSKVIGVILGHCAFGTNGEAKAKYFKRTLYTLEGKLLGKEDTASHMPAVDSYLAIP